MNKVLAGLLLVGSITLPQSSLAGTVYQTTAAAACLPEEGVSWRFNGSAIEKGPTNGAVARPLRLNCAIPLGPATVEPSQLASVLLFVVDRAPTSNIQGSLCFTDLVTGAEACGETVQSYGSSENQSLLLHPPADFAAWVQTAYLKIIVPFVEANAMPSRVKGFIVYSQN